MLKSYAFHYQTGEPIPDALMPKLEKSRHFNQGFEMVEYLAASFRKHLLSVGSNDMMSHYVKFGGSEPKVDALLERRGLN